MKKIRNILSIFLLLLSLVSFNVQCKANDETFSIKDESLSLIYADHGNDVFKYHLSESGYEFELLFDIKNDVILINNRKFTNSEYDLITHGNNVDLIISEINMRNIDYELIHYYDSLHLQYESYINNHGHILSERCMFCPLATTQVPTTNYSTQEYSFPKQTNEVEIEMTEWCISKLAAFLTGGTTVWIEDFISEILIKGAAQSINCVIEYIPYQSFHNICPMAIKERRYVTATWGASRYEVNKSYTYYFFNGKPY